MCSDNLDPHGLSVLKESLILATGLLWAVQLRSYVRVKGIVTRVVDTRLICRFDEGHDEDDGRGGGGGRVRVVHQNHS